MSTFVPQWVSADSIMGGQNLMSAYIQGQNPALPLGVEPAFMTLIGVDPSLGVGQFMYGQLTNAAGCVAGDVCEVLPGVTGGSSISVVPGFQQWAGTVNTGKPLVVALATLTQNQYGWFQYYGAALVNTNGAIAAGNSAYWQAAGKIQAAAVASKQMTSAMALVANSASFGQSVAGVTPTISATQAVYFLNTPNAQDAIT